MPCRLKSSASRLFIQPFIQGAGHRKHQSRWISCTSNAFPFDDVIMLVSLVSKSQQPVCLNAEMMEKGKRIFPEINAKYKGLNHLSSFDFDVFSCYRPNREYWKVKVTAFHICTVQSACAVGKTCMGVVHEINSLAPGRFEWNFWYWVIFKTISMIDGWHCCLTILEWSCPQMSANGPYIWNINTGSGDGLVPWRNI